MGGVIGLDVGGANTKAVWRDGAERRVASRPFEVWRDRDALAAVLREVVASLGEPEAVALTMTAELSDVFRTKREGVSFVLDAAEAALAGTRLAVLNTVGELLAVGAARASGRSRSRPRTGWPARSSSPRTVPEALMIDVGGTTADLIPIAGGDVVVRGRTDLDRLMTGELVYTGVLRTNLASIAGHVPVRGGWCPVASELFAISADVHLILGHIGPEATRARRPTAGRPPSSYARERVARLVCADADSSAPTEIDAIAAYLHGEQVRRVEDAARDVAAELTALAPVVPLGSGAFLARDGGRAARRRGARPAVERGRARRRAGRRAGRARVRAAARAVLTVVKVGGGLAREAGEDALRALCATIGEAAGATGCSSCRAAGASRTRCATPTAATGSSDAAAHRMAILAMEQFGVAAERADPGGRAPDARGPTARPPVLAARAAAVDDPLPASWEVTSDSIAAWVARRAGAGRLVLVKPVDGLYREWPPAGRRSRASVSRSWPGSAVSTPTWRGC